MLLFPLTTKTQQYMRNNFIITNLETVIFFELIDHIMIFGCNSEIKRINEIHELFKRLVSDDLDMFDDYLKHKHVCLNSFENDNFKKMLLDNLDKFKAPEQNKFILKIIYQLLLSEKDLRQWLQVMRIAFIRNIKLDLNVTSPLVCNNKMYLYLKDKDTKSVRYYFNVKWFYHLELPFEKNLKNIREIA